MVSDIVDANGCFLTYGLLYFEVPLLVLGCMDGTRRTEHAWRNKERARQADTVKGTAVGEASNKCRVSTRRLTLDISKGTRRKRSWTNEELIVQRRIIQEAVCTRTRKHVVEDSNSTSHHGIGTSAAGSPGKTETRFPRNISVRGQCLVQPGVDCLVIGLSYVMRDPLEIAVESGKTIGLAHWIGVMLRPESKRELQIRLDSPLVLPIQT